MFMNILEEHSGSIFAGQMENRGSMSPMKTLYPPVRLNGPIIRNSIMLNIITVHFPWTVSVFITNQTHTCFINTYTLLFDLIF